MICDIDLIQMFRDYSIYTVNEGNGVVKSGKLLIRTAPAVDFILPYLYLILPTVAGEQRRVVLTTAEISLVFQ